MLISDWFFIMFKRIVGKISSTTYQSLTKQPKYPFYNEVPKYDPSKDYYSTLEINKKTSETDIKKSYYRLAKAYHPDSNKGH